MGTALSISQDKHDAAVSSISKTLQNTVGSVSRQGTGHVFGLPHINTQVKLDTRSLKGILNVDTNNFTIRVQASCKVDTIMDYLKPLGLSLKVPIDLRHLTCSGLVCGVGGGSTSYRNGWFHSQVLSMEVVTADGNVLECSPTQHSNLFYALPNSLGTLCHLTAMTIKLERRTSYVNVRFFRFKTAREFFNKIKTLGNKRTLMDFMEGTILDPLQNPFPYVLMCGEGTNRLTPDSRLYTKYDVLWQVIGDTNIISMDFPYDQYMWRHDRDMYYTTTNPELAALRNPVLRALVPENALNTNTYRWFAKTFNCEHHSPEANDVFIPVQKAELFDQWYRENYALYPVYICPVQCEKRYSLWGPTKGLHIDFGIAYGVNSNFEDKTQKLQELESQMKALGGRKLLYTCTNLETESDMWETLDADADVYKRLKDKYDPENRLLTLYDKIKIRNTSNV